MQKITPFLWFDGNAEEAAHFYAGIFKEVKLGEVRRYGEAGPRSNGSVMSVSFALFGQEFIALNGGPQFSFTPAISFFVSCETQDEVDDLWEKLGAGGAYNRCGWLTDRFGVTWQIVPRVLGELLQDKDSTRSRRVMEAMFTMSKLDIAALRRAYDRAA